MSQIQGSGGADTAPPQKLAYTVKEACEATTLKMSALYYLLREGKLRARKIGRRTVVLADDLKAYLDSLPAAELTPREGKQ
ncbi:hypothetical protein BA190_09190 [Labrys sp. WJW]|uniref:helix-turn-helix domain-containing protein n=1 Tax=Labrys sp. WJW TaxID=1737983 RepID=UPI00082D0189|nr:helix-turn-helix domain-containing protein [Labrys sp. WJW]OCC05079.1 hypothetical protein BA190_09190 [Labrys sp. WJW]